MLLLSINALYAADSSKENEYPDQNAMTKPLLTQQAPDKKVKLEEIVAIKAEEVLGKINNFFESEETKAVQSAAALIAQTGWGYTKSFFYNEKDGILYRNICVVGALGGLYYLKKNAFRVLEKYTVRCSN